MHVACHPSIRSVDHLSDIVKQSMPLNSGADSIRLHRTKCTALLKKVIAPYFQKELINDMKDTPFSIILDESTDIACIKHLCVCVRYFSKSAGKIISQFCGLVEVSDSTAEALYQHVQDFFTAINIDLGNCIAIGTDGAANLCERHH